MDSNPDTSLYSDLGFSQDYLAEPPLVDINPVASPDPSLDPMFTQDSVGGLPGTVVNLAQLIATLIGDVGQAVSYVEDGHPLTWLKSLGPFLSEVGGLIDRAKNQLAQLQQSTASDDAHALAVAGANAWQFVANWTGGFIYRGMLEAGLEVDTSQFDADANRGINTIDTMLTFSFMLQWISAALDGVGTGLFGGRWGKAFSHAIRELPEELGITWSMGMAIDEAFKTAVGRSVEEGINRQKHGNRIEWPQMRTLLKQHALTGLQTDGNGHITGKVTDVPDTPGIEVFRDLMLNQGFPDWQIDLLARLNDVQIPVADIAQLYYREVISGDRAKELIAQLGFSSEQTGWLYDLYVAKSENEATTEYRSIARQLFQNHLIAEAQYRTILEEAHYPKMLIDGDITAIKLLQEAGKVLQSVSVIKTRYQHGELNADSAAQALRELNYSPSFIAELVHTWDLLPLRRKHGLSQAKILSYFQAGVIKDPKDALAQLMATGLTQDAAQFLLDHPTAGGAKTHKLTPGLVTQAYVDGAIAQADLSAAFVSTGVTAEALSKYLAVAQYRLAHRKGSPAPVQDPTTSLYREAQKEGIIDFQKAVSLYESLGWSPDHALMIAEIVNKGPYVAPSPPIFSTLLEALAYLTDHGYAITPPQDPTLGAAENLALQHGYTFTKTTGGIVQVPTLSFTDQNAVIAYLIAKGFTVGYPSVP